MDSNASLYRHFNKRQYTKANIGQRAHPLRNSALLIHLSPCYEEVNRSKALNVILKLY